MYLRYMQVPVKDTQPIVEWFFAMKFIPFQTESDPEGQTFCRLMLKATVMDGTRGLDCNIGPITWKIVGIPFPSMMMDVLQHLE